MTPEHEYRMRQIAKEEVAEHRDEVDTRMNQLHSDIVALRTDVHTVAGTVSEMNVSLQKIAVNSAALADWSQTWVKVKNFWDVINWFKKNWFLFAILGGIIYATLWMVGVRVMVG